MGAEGGSKRVSRREVLAAGVAAAGAAIASVVAPRRARAADGDPLNAGEANTASSTTALSAPASGAVFTGEHTGAGAGRIGLLGVSTGPDASAGDPQVPDGKSAGVVGLSTDWYGVLGRSTNQYGVYGTSANRFGVLGYCEQNTGVFGEGRKGVVGFTEDGVGTGVVGLSGVSEASPTPAGVGVYGLGTTAGVRADSTAGRALDVRGKAVFSRSGRALIAAGRTYRDVSCSSLTTSSMVLATLQGSGGSGVAVAYCSRLSSTRFRIVLTKAAARNVYAAWFVLN